MTTPADDDPGTTTLRRLKSFDNETWAKIVETHFLSVYRWCQENGLDPHSAADVTQEVFVSALGSLRNFEKTDDGSFSGWLRRISQRRIADYQRRKSEKVFGGTDALKLFHRLASARSAINAEDIQEIMTIDDDVLIEALALAQKEFHQVTWQAFWQAVIEGKPTTDVALELGITKNSVYLAKSRIAKRLRELANGLSPKISEPDTP
jgi:RNA polymerase sigma-70 factor (ECF subfamily)